MNKNYKIKTGHRNPPGASPDANGVNFSVFSRHATAVELLLFRRADSPEPFQVIPLDVETHRTFFVWHVYVQDLPIGTWYAWRMDGPNDARESGLRFDRQKVLLDPWARAVSDKIWQRAVACRQGDNLRVSMRGIIVDNGYDWEGDTPLPLVHETCVIYEMHVGGFTRHPSSGVKHPGTFAGLIEKIPYLQQLGITHVELLPVMAFDEQDVPENTAKLGLNNYWGYSTHSFYSPHPGYCVSPEKGTHLQEFRDLVKALHKAGIGVIMDVVFNHTAEGGEFGPIISFKGMGNNIFYHIDPIEKNVFRDYTGCGNTVNANHPLVANFIIGCLEYWVREMHVDGFRFDLASALARGENGQPLHDSPVLWGIELSEQLAETKLIAEAWDAAGLYQVGSFPGYRWAEWNGRYRDIVRRFIRGDQGLLSEFATRLCGSSDLYKHQGRLPINSINFVTCHDGFTLYDWVSYNQKHNQANGENNRDGSNDNLSCNCGVEGETDDRQILALRRQQAKNVIAVLMLSQGIPMILSGDEILGSQQGNNNGYCQDNELTWFDWRLVKKNEDMLRFVSLMIAFRRSHPSLMRRRFLTGMPPAENLPPDISWYGSDLNLPQWDDSENRVLAFALTAVERGEADLYVMLNMSDQPVTMQIPKFKGRKWYLAIDTSQPAPYDIIETKKQRPMRRQSYLLPAKTIVVLEGKNVSWFYF